MSGVIPPHVIEEIRTRCDIVDLVSEFLSLKKAGKNYKGLCPFHQEKTPSFIVSPEKQVFKCFGCGVGGDIFSFVMRQENIDFPDAVRRLAEKMNIVIPVITDTAEGGEKKKLYELNKFAADYFHKLFENRKGAQRYLKKREIDTESFERFYLGYADESWDGLLREARKAGFSLSLLELSGLIIRRTKGEGFYDRFRSRLIFPIYDLQDRVIAFGGRLLDGMREEQPKYINSPETPVYSKGRNLYGLNWARDAVRSSGNILIMEGYFDLVRAFQAGIENVVASLGTSLTENQARMIRRYTREVLMVFDPDVAGVKATMRGLDLLVREGMRVKIVFLDDKRDPDAFIREEGISAFQKRVKQAKDLVDYKLDFLCKEHDRENVAGRVDIIKEMLPTIAEINHDVEKRDCLKKLAERLFIPEDVLLMELNKEKRVKERGKGNKYNIVRSYLASKPPLTAEKEILQLMLEDRKFVATVKDQLVVDDFQHPEYRRIISLLFTGASASDLQGEEVQSVLADLIVQTVECSQKKKSLEECIHKIRIQRMKRLRKELYQKIKEAEGKKQVSQVNELLEEYQKLFTGEDVEYAKGS